MSAFGQGRAVVGEDAAQIGIDRRGRCTDIRPGDSATSRIVWTQAPNAGLIATSPVVMRRDGDGRRTGAAAAALTDQPPKIRCFVRQPEGCADS